MTETEAVMFDVNLNNEVNRNKLEWIDVSYSIRRGQRILNNVSGNCLEGELLAVMGPTGCGKSSLCNVLSGRIRKTSPNTKLVGNVEYNNHFVFKDYDAVTRYRESIAYVQQVDELFPFLTVRETLLLSAYFHFPLSTDASDIVDAVDFAIQRLGLRLCQDTYITNLSGGEKKRVNIGKQVITNPDVIFVDEPTSGLDSFQALNVMEILKRLCHNGKIVIAVIHQPRSSITQLFDKLLLLCEGNVVYFGPAPEAIHHFESIGYSCPPQFNPADFLLDLISVDTRSDDREQESKAVIANIISYYKAISTEEMKEPVNNARKGLISSTSVDSLHQEDENNLWVNLSLGNNNANATQLFHAKPPAASKSCMESFQKWWWDLMLLSWRATVQIQRNSIALWIRSLTQLFFAIIISLLYNLTLTQAGIQNRNGLLFFLTINQAFSALQGPINSFVDEKKLVENERVSMSYSLSAYFISRVLSEFPIMIALLLVYSTIIYWGTGLQPEPVKFFIFIGFIALVTVNGGALGYLISAISSTSLVANALGTPILIILLLFGGFYINSSTIPGGSEWIPYIDFLSWGYRGLALNEFQGLTFSCTPEEIAAAGSQPCEANGDVVIRNLGFSEYNLDTCAWALVVIYIGCLILAFMGLSLTAAERGFLKMKLKIRAYNK